MFGLFISLSLSNINKEVAIAAARQATQQAVAEAENAIKLGINQVKGLVNGAKEAWEIKGDVENNIDVDEVWTLLKPLNTF